MARARFYRQPRTVLRPLHFVLCYTCDAFVFMLSATVLVQGTWEGWVGKGFALSTGSGPQFCCRIVSQVICIHHGIGKGGRTEW